MIYFADTSGISAPRGAVRQKGMATLAISMLVLLLTTFIVLAVGRASVFEQRVAGNDLRVKESYAAASKGLEYTVDWLRTNWPNNWYSEEALTTLVIDDYIDDVVIGGANPVNRWATLDAALPSTVAGTDSYTHTIRIRHMTASGVYPPILELKSTATGSGDTQTSKTIGVYVMRTSILSGGIGAGPPLIVEECLANGFNGTLDIWPLESGESIGTVNGTAGCINTAGVNDHGGFPTAATVSGDDLSELFFGATGAEIYDLYGESELFYYVTAADNVNNWHESIGTQWEPAILYFAADAGCPSFNGGPVIYGIIFYEADDCETPGLGDAQVWGTVVYSGNLLQITGNAQLDDLDFSTSLGGGTSVIADVTQIPGTLRDWGY